MGKELFLDTKGTCFLCLQEPTECGNNTDKVMMKEVCLRNICRYLKINPCSVLLKSLIENGIENKRGDSTDNQKDDCDFSVMLCVTCSSLANNISDLIKQMDIMTILMNHQLKVFNQIVRNDELGKGSGGNWKRLQQKMEATCDNPVELILVKHLRHETMTMCSLKVINLEASTFPKVMINRLKAKMCNASSLQNTFSSERSFFPKNSQYPDLQRKNISSTSKERIMKNIFTDNFVKSPGTLENKYRCKHCSFEVRFDRYIFGRHLANVHPEVLFAGTQLPEISKKSFKFCCNRLLTTLLQAGENNNVKFIHTKKYKSCSFCNRKCSKARELRYHLVLEHFTTLEERLVCLQKGANMDNRKDDQVPNEEPESSDEEPPPILEDQTLPHHYYLNGINTKINESSSTKTNIVSNFENNKSRNKNRNKRKTWICDLGDGGCGKVLASDTSMKRHKIDFCPNRRFRKVWTCKSKNGGCARKFTSYHSLSRHKQHHCAYRKSGNVIFKCDVTNKEFSKSFLSQFTLKIHKSSKCSQLINRIDRRLWACDSCGKKFASNNVLKRHKNSFCPNVDQTVKKLWLCIASSGGCGKTFSEKDSLTRHQEHFCPNRRTKLKMGDVEKVFHRL